MTWLATELLAPECNDSELRSKVCRHFSKPPHFLIFSGAAAQPTGGDSQALKCLFASHGKMEKTN